MSFSDEVAAEYAPPPSLADKLRACLAEWFGSVGITDPPPVELHDTTVPYDYGYYDEPKGSEPAMWASWEYDGYKYFTTAVTAMQHLTPGNLSVSIETRHAGIRDARTRQEIGYAITLDRA